MLLGVLGGLGLDLCAKGLLSDYSLQQFVFLRSLVTAKWPWHLLRTLLATGAMFGFFYGLARMPLVDAPTLGFTAPLMVTALSAPMLGEHVGWRRWTAVSIGIVGVLVILRPGGWQTPDLDGWVLFLLAGACSVTAWNGIVGGYRRLLSWRPSNIPR